MAREIAFAVFVLIWPLGAWFMVTVRGVPRSEAWRSFARAAAILGVIAAVVVGLGVWAGVTNGTTGGMWAAGALLVGSLPLLGALLSSLVALVLRATIEEDPHRKAVLIAVSVLVVALAVVVGWWLWGVLTHTPADPGPDPEEEAPNTPSDVPAALREPQPPAPTGGARSVSHRHRTLRVRTQIRRSGGQCHGFGGGHGCGGAEVFVDAAPRSRTCHH